MQISHLEYINYREIIFIWLSFYLTVKLKSIHLTKYKTTTCINSNFLLIVLLKKFTYNYLIIKCLF
jgi:hypothetical protein